MVINLTVLVIQMVDDVVMYTFSETPSEEVYKTADEESRSF